jgi:hypothetical protein
LNFPKLDVAGSIPVSRFAFRELSRTKIPAVSVSFQFLNATATHWGACSIERVYGEFLLMPQLEFGITHDNGSASDNV